MGRKKRPYYRIVAVDSRRKRDGAFIDRIGFYHPIETPATLLIDADKALKWLRVGAIPSDTVLSLLKKEGVWLRYRLERRGLPEAQINTMMNEWFVKHNKSVVTIAAKVEEAPATNGAAVMIDEGAPVVAAPAIVEEAKTEEAVAEPTVEESKGE